MTWRVHYYELGMDEDKFMRIMDSFSQLRDLSDESKTVIEQDAYQVDEQYEEFADLFVGLDELLEKEETIPKVGDIDEFESVQMYRIGGERFYSATHEEGLYLFDEGSLEEHSPGLVEVSNRNVP